MIHKNCHGDKARRDREAFSVIESGIFIYLRVNGFGIALLVPYHQLNFVRKPTTHVGRRYQFARHCCVQTDSSLHLRQRTWNEQRDTRLQSVFAQEVTWTKDRFHLCFQWKSGQSRQPTFNKINRSSWDDCSSHGCSKSCQENPTVGCTALPWPTTCDGHKLQPSEWFVHKQMGGADQNHSAYAAERSNMLNLRELMGNADADQLPPKHQTTHSITSDDAVLVYPDSTYKWPSIKIIIVAMHYSSA